MTSLLRAVVRRLPRALEIVSPALLMATTALAQAEMSAVMVREYGDASVLRVERVARPVPGEGEMLIRVQAAGVNPVDVQVRSGQGRRFAGGAFPYRLGFDVSGIVVETGVGVTDFQVGDEIFALLDLSRGGGYAEYAIVKPSEAVVKPDALSHIEAAAVPLVTLTAWQALFDTAQMESGETVLIHAGAGGVGSMAIQLAKWRGARVIATASEPNHAFLRELGADVVVDYRTERFEDYADDVDVVLDPVGGETQTRSLAIMAEDGRLVTIVASGLTDEAKAPPRSITAQFILVHPAAEQLRQISSLLETGRIRTIVTHTMPLAEVADAHEQSETGHTRGKIVLVVDAVDR